MPVFFTSEIEYTSEKYTDPFFYSGYLAQFYIHTGWCPGPVKPESEICYLYRLSGSSRCFPDLS
jgi:hypothetical protein